jgi:hypothetical protein
VTASSPTSGAKAASVADRFIQAIVWGEHVVVWDLLSEAGREYVLEAGARRGLDPLQAQRIRQGTSPQDESDAFLTGLVHGLRVDFAAVPLGDVRAEDSAPPEDAQSVEVSLRCPAAFGEAAWAAGSLLLSRVDDTWRVDRVRPLVSRSE